MNNIDKFSGVKISAVWPITLIGFPISVIIFLVTGSMYEIGRFGFWLTVFSKILIFSSMLFAMFNFIFCLYSSINITVRNSISLGLISILGSFLSVGLVSYLFYWFWRSQGVELFSIRGKRFFDAFACSFYGFFIFIVIISIFFVGNDFGKF